MARTTVAVDMRTRDALKRLGRKGESYDAIIRRLIAQYRRRGASQEARPVPAPRRDVPMDIA